MRSFALRAQDDKVRADRPLEGLRIIDLSMGWAGPVCTRNLADLGADVIKIEACGYPDWWRGVDNRAETVTQRLYEKSSRFNIMNRGKRAITLDLTVPDGVALAKALVKDADAVIENYSAEVLRKFGLDYAELTKVNPSLVMVSMAAFGASGPWRETRAYGSTLEQGSGLPSVGGRAQDPPMMNHLAYGDAVGGLNACSAMLVALLHRRETGEGQFIDLSQVQCMLPFTAAWAIEQSANGKVTPRAGNRHPSFVPHGVFPSAGTDNGCRSPSPTMACGPPSPASSASTILPSPPPPHVAPTKTASRRRSRPGRPSVRLTKRWRPCRKPAWPPARFAIRWNCWTTRTSRRAVSGNGSSAPMSAVIRSPRRPIAMKTLPSQCGRPPPRSASTTRKSWVACWAFPKPSWSGLRATASSAAKRCRPPNARHGR